MMTPFYEELRASDPDSNYAHMLSFDPNALVRDMEVIRDTIQTEITFEPASDVVDASILLEHAANVLHFVEIYIERTGSTELPPYR